MATRVSINLQPTEDGGAFRVVSLRPLWARETEQLEDMFPRPVPPLGKNPLRGSLAEPVPNEADAGYQASIRKWFREMQRAQLYFAFQPSPIKGMERDAVAREAEKLADQFTGPELQYLWTRLQELSTRSLVEQAIKQVVVVRTDGEATGEPLSIPDAYDLTEAAILYRAACRAGQDPHRWPADLSPEQRAQTIAHEIILRREEAEQRETLRAVAALLGAQ